MSVLPYRIIVPLSLASTFKIRGGGITGRDISYAFSVAHLAVLGSPIMQKGALEGMAFKIPDTGLRKALGLTRRDTQEREARRFERMQTMYFFVGGEWHSAPNVYFRRSSGGRYIPEHTMRDKDLVNWVVRPEVREAFMTDGSGTVAIPTDVLQNARCRYTLPIVMRMLAWMDTKPKFRHWVKGEGQNYLNIRMPWGDFVRDLGIPEDMTPGNVIQDYLEPINRETGMSVEIDVEAIYGGTRRNPRGRVKDISIFMHVLPPSKHELMLYDLEKVEPSRGWRRPDRQASKEAKRGRPRKPRPEPASTDNVAVLDTLPRIPLYRPPLPPRPTGTTTPKSAPKPAPEEPERMRTLDEIAHLPRPKPPQRPPED